MKPLTAMEQRERISSKKAMSLLDKIFTAKRNGQKVSLKVRMGAVSDFMFIGDERAKIIQQHISDTTKISCSNYKIMDIQGITIGLNTDDITAKLLVKGLVKQLQLHKTIIMVSECFIFDNMFFAQLGFKKLKMSDGEQYLYWANNDISNRIRVKAA